jgi:drug/metabolite transporter (DMT)-like permease
LTPAVLIALLSAVLYGAADFVGGMTSRRASTLAVVFVSQLAGGIALLAMLPLFPAATVLWPDAFWGAAAGLAGGVGVALLYQGLSIGTMSVVAPTTAVCAVAIPVAVSIFLGERPSLVALSGMAIALLAIVLVSQSPAPSSGTPHGRSRATQALLIAVGSGVAIGIFFLALARTSGAAGLWPLLVARCASALLFAAMALVSGVGRLKMPRAVLPMAIGCGVLDMGANGLYLVATRGGALSVIVTLASLYPASTVILARLILHERLGRLQIAGVVACLIAIVLIVRG